MKNPITCEICGKECSCNGLHHHIRRVHDISWEEYKKKYDLFQQCNYDRPGLIENIDYIVCQICGEKLGVLGKHLVFKHNMGVREYGCIYSSACLCPRNISEKNSKKWNLDPALNPNLWSDERRAKSTKSGTANLVAYNKSPQHSETAIRSNSDRWGDPAFRASASANMSAGAIKRMEDPVEFEKRRLMLLNNLLHLGKKKLYTGPKGTIQMRGYEVELAHLLDLANIDWVHEPNYFEYFRNGVKSTYTPDFYLPEIDYYIDVKAIYIIQREESNGYPLELKIKAVQDFGHKLLVITEDNWDQSFDFIKSLFHIETDQQFKQSEQPEQSPHIDQFSEKEETSNVLVTV